MASHRLNREFIYLQQTNVPNILARPLESNILEWRFAIFDLPDPYLGGVYHGKIVFPPEYPLRPPSIQMLTPSGRFQTNTKICMSMTDFHPESWNPAWRVETVLLGLVSFMLDAADPATAGGLNDSVAARRVHAIRSFSFNCQDRIFRQLFPELTDGDKFLDRKGFFYRTTPPQELLGPTSPSEAAAVETRHWNFVLLLAVIGGAMLAVNKLYLDEN